MTQVIAFVVAHQAVLAALGVAVLDLIFAIAPGAASSGILHFLLLQLQSLLPPAPPAPPAA